MFDGTEKPNATYIGKVIVSKNMILLVRGKKI